MVRNVLLWERFFAIKGPLHMKTFILCLLTIGILACGQPAAAVTLDFEGLSDLDSVTSQFAGLTFANTTAFVSGAAGGSLNELDFPPHSGVTVVAGDSGAITITFDSPVASVSGFFTYSAALTITAFDALLAAVDTVTSAFGANTAASGDGGSTPNELLSVAAASGIASLTIEGAADAAFVLDDLTFVPIAVPEPRMLGSLLCATAALLAVAARQQRWARAV